MDLFSEIEDIGKILKYASVLSCVRQEVNQVMKKGFVVTDGLHQDGANAGDVVIRCGGDIDKVERRLITTMPDLQIARIAEGILAVRTVPERS